MQTSWINAMHNYTTAAKEVVKVIRGVVPVATWRLILIVGVSTTVLISSGMADPGSFGPEDAIRRFNDIALEDVSYVEVESEENSFHGGATHFSRIAYVDGVWLLLQRDVINNVWHLGAILVENDIAYFTQMGQETELIAQTCTSCHANGPRLIRGRIVSGDPDVVKSYNALIRDSGLIRAYEPLESPACTSCHNNVNRTALTRFNEETIYYLVSRNHMPPDRALTAPERKAIFDWIKTETVNH